MQELTTMLAPLLPLIPIIYIGILFLVALLSGRVLPTLAVAIAGLIIMVILHCYVFFNINVICTWIPLCTQASHFTCVTVDVFSIVVQYAIFIIGAVLLSWIIPKSKKGR